MKQHFVVNRCQMPPTPELAENYNLLKQFIYIYNIGFVNSILI
jgi:hypothetical protein